MDSDFEPLQSWGNTTADDSLQINDCWALRIHCVYHTQDGGSVLGCPHLSSAKNNRVCIPIQGSGMLNGLLSIKCVAGSRQFETARIVAELIGMTLATTKFRQELYLKSILDPLTGVENRRALDAALSSALRRDRRRQLPTSILMLDIDHFKHFNDQNGHAVGDEILQKAAKHFKVRGTDRVFRYGGEEFVVMLPEASLNVAVKRAEEIQASLKQLPQYPNCGPITVSIGVATAPFDGESAEELLKAADLAVYRAKETGRNRVVIAAEMELA
jgi:diguanylate cyclase (GGDEF)-like protein